MTIIFKFILKNLFVSSSYKLTAVEQYQTTTIQFFILQLVQAS